MGLLDEAIREHLELKRLRGADPALVSREERGAFGAPRSGGPVDGDDAAPAPGGVTAKPSDAKAMHIGEEGFAHVGQETAEIDMSSVLRGGSNSDGNEVTAADSSAPAAPSPAAPVRARPLTDPNLAAQRTGVPGESLEWEMPGDDAKGDPDDDALSDEPVADVLEETPDFLRETPEQERLWFEQRPPRDFDFDK